MAQRKNTDDRIRFSHGTEQEENQSISESLNPEVKLVGGLYRDTLPTYSDGDNAILHFSDDGKLLVDADLNVSDIQIGAVEIKDATSDNRVIVDSNGALKVTGGASSVNAEYKSPNDFNATYTSSTTITLSALPFTIVDSSQIQYITVVPATGSAATYVNGANGITITNSSNVLTISGVTDPFASGDVYQVGINSQNKAYDLSTNSQMSSVLNPDSEKYVQDSLVDTTNLAAATEYYPSAIGMSMDGFKDLSLTGKFIDADGTITMTIEATNDEDSTNADWVQIYGFDSNGNAMVNTITVTNGTVTYALDFDNLNYSLFRIKLVTSGATNTVIIKSRRKA